MKIKCIFILAFILAFSLTACSVEEKTKDGSPDTVESKDEDSYKIGVIVYSNTDQEVLAFREYLESYIEKVFPDVSFLYSSTITSEEEELAFINSACDEGAKGFLSFLTLDLEKEVALCQERGAYYMVASGSVSEEDFKVVEDNPYFLGAVGPGGDMEYETGTKMADYFIGQDSGDEYFILSGGAPIGNEMHLQRTMGILDKLKESYGVEFDKSSEEIALSDKPVHLNAGDLKVCVTPGYIEYDRYFATAKEEYLKERYGNVLSVLPIAQMADVVKGAHLGVVDCYSTGNLELFNAGILRYVAGKYSSIVGPSFAAMYNALTGYAEDYRENGKAFQLTQGFWYSGDYDDYVEKYSLANSVVTNAYNYEDLEKVCKKFNPDSTLKDLENLIEAYSFEDAKARRGLK